MRDEPTVLSLILILILILFIFAVGTVLRRISLFGG
jgi:hypothetical protein